MYHHLSAVEIMQAFFGIRIEYYTKRREYLLGKLAEEYDRLDNKV
jgi:DNA gyrase/topoisomerase IV subunit A